MILSSGLSHHLIRKRIAVDKTSETKKPGAIRALVGLEMGPIQLRRASIDRAPAPTAARTKKPPVMADFLCSINICIWSARSRDGRRVSRRL